MKIEINTKEKTIMLLEDINIKELFEELLDLGIDFTEYTICANSILTYTPQWDSPFEFPTYPIYSTSE